MSTSNWLIQLKRSRLDYVILIIAFLLIASNQVFETTSLRATGNLEITEESPIPQGMNHTIANNSVPSVTSAVLLDESIMFEYIYTTLLLEHVNKLLVNVTLQAASENTTVRIFLEIGRYHDTVNVVAGTQPQTISIEPDIDLVLSSSLISYCWISTDPSGEMNQQRVVVGAEFDMPLSPVVLDLRTTDGHDLFMKNRSRTSLFGELYLRIYLHQDNLTDYLRIHYQNQTLYLWPQNYTITASWDYHSYTIVQFDLTVQSNMGYHCLIHARVVRVNLNFNLDFPYIQLELEGYSSRFPAYSFRARYSDLPKFIYISPLSSVDITISSRNPVDTTDYFNDEITVHANTGPLGNYSLNAEVSLPYVSFLGLYVTPTDLVQIVLAIFLFTILVTRMFIFIESKRPRISWRDFRVIPLLFIGLTAFIPWYSALHTMGYINESVHIASFGVFPLLVGWTDAGSIFLAMPSNGVLWVFASLILFCIPLLYANYTTSPPSIIDDNYLASLLMFSPLLLMGSVNYGLAMLYDFTFAPILFIQIILVFVPFIFLSCLVLFRLTGRYEYGRHQNQLELDMNLADQLAEKKSQTELMDSRGTLEDEEPQNPIELEARKTVNLVLVILQFLFFLIPTSIGYYFERILISTRYSLTDIWYGNPLNSAAVFLGSIMGTSGSSVFWMLCIPAYFIFTFGIIGEFGMKSRRGLTIILMLLWGIIPFILLPTISMTHYYYIGVEWILVSLPYFILNCVTVMKIGAYIKDETNLRSVLVWIVLPVIFMIPGGLILNLIAAIRMASSVYWAVVWIPLPIATIILIIVIWPLRYWYKRTQDNLDADVEMDEMLHSGNPAGDI